MKKNIISISIILAVITLVKEVQATTSSYCYSRGYKNCLDINGRCTNSYYSCSDTCFYNSDCIFDCCQDGYCGFSSVCRSSTVNVIAIVIPVVFGAFFLVFFIICYCIRKRRLAALRANMQATQNMQAQNMNNVMMQQNAFVVGQQPAGQFQYGVQTPFQANQVPVGYDPNIPLVYNNNMVMMNQQQQPQGFGLVAAPNMNQQMYGVYQQPQGVANPMVSQQQYPNNIGVVTLI